MDCISGPFARCVFLDEDHFRRANKPLLHSCAEVEHTLPADKRRGAVDTLVENKVTPRQAFLGFLARLCCAQKRQRSGCEMGKAKSILSCLSKVLNVVDAIVSLGLCNPLSALC